MAEYKDTITCWLNKSKNNDGLYLTITDIESDKTTFVNMHKFWTEAIREAQNKGVKFPKVPMFTKSIKVEEPNEPMTDKQVQEVTDDVPF